MLGRAPDLPHYHIFIKIYITHWKQDKPWGQSRGCIFDKSFHFLFIISILRQGLWGLSEFMISKDLTNCLFLYMCVKFKHSYTYFQKTLINLNSLQICLHKQKWKLPKPELNIKCLWFTTIHLAIVYMIGFIFIEQIHFQWISSWFLWKVIIFIMNRVLYIIYWKFNNSSIYSQPHIHLFNNDNNYMELTFVSYQLGAVDRLWPAL